MIDSTQEGEQYTEVYVNPAERMRFEEQLAQARDFLKGAQMDLFDEEGKKEMAMASLDLAETSDEKEMLRKLIVSMETTTAELKKKITQLEESTNIARAKIAVLQRREATGFEILKLLNKKNSTLQ